MMIKTEIPDRVYFRMGDVADLVGVKPYVIRYWESEFPFISPEKSSSGQRSYRRSEVESILMIKHLLYEKKYSIEGARRKIKELRKSGELKSYREVQSETMVRAHHSEAVLAELMALASIPSGEFFRLGAQPPVR